MFHSRYTHKKLNKLHELALRIVYYDYESTFEQLLEKDCTFSTYHQNIQRLVTKHLTIHQGLHLRNFS